MSWNSLPDVLWNIVTSYIVVCDWKDVLSQSDIRIIIPSRKTCPDHSGFKMLIIVRISMDENRFVIELIRGSEGTRDDRFDFEFLQTCEFGASHLALTNAVLGWIKLYHEQDMLCVCRLENLDTKINESVKKLYVTSDQFPWLEMCKTSK